jgi:NodT family efflux transporter outer membrane factor (OMF) lipoprotein
MKHASIIRAEFVIGSLLFTLSGCAVGPTYVAPAMPAPSAFYGAKSASVASAEVDPARWWEALHDPELNRLVQLAMQGNLDLQTVRTRIAGARAQEQVAYSARLPTLGGRAAVNHIDFSKNAGLSSIASATSGASAQTPPGQGVALPGNGITTWSLGLDASWEIDLFGGVQHSIEGARARVDAAQWNARDMQVSLVAEVASDYLTLRSIQNQIAIAKEELARQQATLKLLVARSSAGLITELPQRQQARELSNIAANLPQLEASSTAQIRALGVLTGQGSSALMDELISAAKLQGVTRLPVLLPPSTVGLPSELLRRRPDIRAAERQLAAATADIGVATADLYPKFNLMGLAELISTSLGTLFQRNSLQASGNAAISLPIFDGGRRRATIVASNAIADAALLAYKKSVLLAVQDVENALADFEAEQRRNTELRQGLAQADGVVKLVRASFDTGLVDFTSVLDAQAAVLASRNTLAQSDVMLLTDLARLYKALGGGWEMTEEFKTAD